MSQNYQTDVLIVGGGPAGASAALSLTKYTDLSVTLVEQGNFEQQSVGEQVTKAIFDLLDYLGIDHDVVTGEHSVQGFTHLAAWGSERLIARHSMYNIAGESYQIDRDHFDLSLIEAAAESGTRILPNTKCIDFHQEESQGWTVICKHQEHGEFQLNAAYVVDATGRKAFVSRQLGLPAVRIDQLVGVGAFLEKGSYQDQQPEVILETVEEGWWYCAPLPGGRLNITLFTDASVVSKNRLGSPENWLAALKKTTHILKKADKGEIHQQLWVRNAFSQLVDTSSRERFVAIGDAAACFDPLSSMGIGFAMTSGIHAADAIRADLEGEGITQVQSYEAGIRQNFQNFMDIWMDYYNSESRWRESPFWATRKAFRWPTAAPV